MLSWVTDGPFTTARVCEGILTIRIEPLVLEGRNSGQFLVKLFGHSHILKSRNRIDTLTQAKHEGERLSMIAYDLLRKELKV